MMKRINGGVQVLDDGWLADNKGRWLLPRLPSGRLPLCLVTWWWRSQCEWCGLYMLQTGLVI